MPLVLLDDRIEGSMADIGSQGSVATRGNYAYYSPTTDQPSEPSLVIADVYNAIKNSGKQFGSRCPGFPQLGLTRIPITPLGAGQFRYQLIYELTKPGSFGASSAYIIETSSIVQSYQTSFMPGTREPIRVGFNRAKSQSNPNTGQTTTDVSSEVLIPEDFVTMNLIRPVTTIRMTQVKFGKPKGDLSAYVGYVNQDTWLNRPPGYWQLMEFNSRVNRMEGYYTLSATVYSKNMEDWSETGVLVNSITGKKAKISQADIQKVRTAKYQPQKVIKYNGMVHVMPYPWVSFRTLFGFS